MEERIFGFDRQCGSHAGRSLFYLCLCTSFTLSLFTKRDRVAARRFQSSFFLSITSCAPRISPKRRQNWVFSCQTWTGRRAGTRFPFCLSFFRTPAEWPSPELLAFSGFVQCSTIMPDMSCPTLFSPCLSPPTPCALLGGGPVCVISTYTSLSLSTCLGLIVFYFIALRR